jgi:hypothetical protein
MIVHFPPVFRLICVGIVHASFFLTIFIFSSLLCFLLFVLFLFVIFPWGFWLCYITEFVLCWWVLIICISGSTLLSTYSTSYLISDMSASSVLISPLSPHFLGTHNRCTSAVGWCCTWSVSSFLVFLSNFRSSSWCQLVIPEMYLSAGTASDPVVVFYY